MVGSSAISAHLGSVPRLAELAHKGPQEWSKWERRRALAHGAWLRIREPFYLMPATMEEPATWMKIGLL
jgi:hypothetical protein